MRFQKKKKSEPSSKNKIVVDTSALIDGRILKLAESGFLRGSEMIVTNIVLDEMQYLADEGGSLKRGRARYGFEVLNSLRAVKGVRINNQDLDKSELEVDVQLLKLAQKLKAQLFTVDFNLTQRARAEGVMAVNPAELADALKPEILPGETFNVKLVQKGDGRDQAVGYLNDGTMVVAERAGKLMGEKVDLLSTKIIQTDGGRIVFAELAKKGGKQNTKATDNKSAGKPPAPRARGPRTASTTTSSRTPAARRSSTPISTNRSSRPAQSRSPRQDNPRGRGGQANSNSNSNNNRRRRINHKQRAEDELLSALENS